MTFDSILKVAILAVAYFAMGWLGLLLAIPPGFATAVWPPSGIALAGLLWWGPRVWPGVWLGAFLVNVWISLTGSIAEVGLTSLLLAASIAVGSTLQALLGAFLLQRWVGSGRLFERGSAILSFAAIEALSCLLAPTWGVTSLYLAGVVDSAAFLNSWRTWWLGDLIGVLVVTPVLLTWHLLPLLDRKPWRLAEGIGSIVLFSVLSVIVFFGPSSLGGGEYPLAFLPLPFLVWIAFRFVPGGVALATLLLSGIAVYATSLGSGPFVRDLEQESLLLLQAFTGLATMTGLTLAAAITGHKKAEADLLVSQIRFELAVRGSNEGIWDWKIPTNEDYFSDRWCELLGYQASELSPTFKTWSELIHPDDRPLVFEHVQRHLEERIPYDAEYRMLTKSGVYRWYRARGQAVWDETEGIATRMAGSIGDITDRKLAEEQIRELNADLEQRVTKRTAQLQVAVEELTAALAEIKTLKGLVPICAWCKKIRDDQGFWQHLESYLSTHTGAEFTHGMCSTCFEEQSKIASLGEVS